GRFINLDKYYDGGKLIEYTVSEEQLSGYKEPVIGGNATSGFTVTNRLIPPKSPATGDSRQWLPWLGVFVLSGFGLGADAVIRKSKRGKKED
ncbi:MAG: Cna B-type domain-containing protein, partial [Oscillospiraceae bacterium]|nr:Cna B-type domain-containing protein [Oscillospiraceae bacterium]